ncbi:MAG: hypothetical protein CMK50_03035 [Propionibacteriaceae bacterium]|nr:hypothetical protein [Propionibacteriaceae bacterium]
MLRRSGRSSSVAAREQLRGQQQRRWKPLLRQPGVLVAAGVSDVATDGARRDARNAAGADDGQDGGQGSAHRGCGYHRCRARHNADAGAVRLRRDADGDLTTHAARRYGVR